MAILAEAVESVSVVAGSVEKCRTHHLAQPQHAEPRGERDGDADEQDERGADEVHTCMVSGAVRRRGRVPGAVGGRQNTTTGLIVTPASESANAWLMSSKA